MNTELVAVKEKKKMKSEQHDVVAIEEKKMLEKSAGSLCVCDKKECMPQFHGVVRLTILRLHCTTYIICYFRL